MTRKPIPGAVRPFRVDTEVTTSTFCRLLPRRNKVPARVTWTRDDPYAARLAFPGKREWVIALALLAEGLRDLVGEGDVRVGPFDQRWVVVNLRNASQDAYLMLPRKAVKRFVAAVREQVPPNIDTLIAAELRDLLTAD